MRYLQNVQGCDATKANSSNEAGNKIILHKIKSVSNAKDVTITTNFKLLAINTFNYKL